MAKKQQLVGRSRMPTIIAVVTLVVLVGVIGIALYSAQANQEAQAPANQPVTPVNATYPTSLDGGVIVAGSGPTVIDVYEDALCPACAQFEQVYGDRIIDALNAGRVTVRYHLVNLLDQASTPAGYSTAGGNAMMCSVASGAGFPTLHKALYERQPSEGGEGYTADELVTLGQSAGAGPSYEQCVRQNTYAPAIAQNYQQALADPSLQQSSGGRTGFGTPTVVVNGQTVAVNSEQFTAALG